MVAGGEIAIRPSTASIPSSVTVVVSCSPVGSCTIPFDASSQGYFRCSDGGKGSRNGQKAKSRTGLRACYQEYMAVGVANSAFPSSGIILSDMRRVIVVII